MSNTEWINLIGDSGVLAVLAIVLWYGMRHVLPALHTSVIEAIQRNTQELSELDKALEHQRRILARLTVAIIQHDAQVRGVNPDSLGSTEDLLKRVLDTNGK